MSTPLSKNTLTLLISNVGSAGLSFVLSVLIGRALGQDGLGVYAAALAWVFPLSLVADFGLGTLITRDVAQDEAAAETYLRATTRLRLWIGGGLTLALAVAAPLISDHPAVVRGLQLSAPLIIILPFFGLFTAIFRARQVMWPIPWLNIGMLVIQLALTALVFLAGGGVMAALVVNTATSAGQLAAAWGVYRWKFTFNGEHSLSRKIGLALLSLSTRWRGGRGVRIRTVGESTASIKGAVPLHIRILLRRAWPFALAALLAALQTRLGTILLERLTDTAEVGYYAAATRFAEAGRMLPNALFGALFPMLAAALAQQPGDMHRLFRRVILGLAAFGLAVGALFTLLPGLILNLTYGAAFDPAAPALQLAMWALLPSLLRAGRALYWYAIGQEAFVNRVTGIAILIQLGLSLWLIPSHGAAGAALALLLAETAGLALIWRPAYKRQHEGGT